MEIITVTQGSQEWHDLRAKYDTASEAPAMLGISKYQSRNDLLKAKATGLKEEVSSAQQFIFDRGHAAETAARPIVEALIGEDLYPSTCVATIEGLNLLASLDGMTMDETVLWENKLLNSGLADDVRAGNLEPHYWAQLEQQLLVTGAKKVYFTTSDGTAENTIGYWYKSVPERRAQIIAGWKQFRQDLAAYQHAEPVVAAVGTAVARLPALTVSLVGEVTSSNLALYKETAIGFITKINTDLKTDQDFADAEKVVKFCDSAEKELDLVKAQALAQTATIDELFRTVDALKEAMRAKRLELEKLIKVRKESIKGEIVLAAAAELKAHISALNDRLGRTLMPVIAADFQGAIKGKRTIDSLQIAASNELTRAKIEASMIADRIQINLRSEELAEFQFLFADLPTICTKEAEDFDALVRVRVSEHLAKEEERIARERSVQVEVPMEDGSTLIVLEEAHRADVSGMSVMMNAPVTRLKPSDDQIIRVLSRTFGASDNEVIEWIRDMDLMAYA
jgi:putative phage-type endonuclease